MSGGVSIVIGHLQQSLDAVFMKNHVRKQRLKSKLRRAHVTGVVVGGITQMAVMLGVTWKGMILIQILDEKHPIQNA